MERRDFLKRGSLALVSPFLATACARAVAGVGTMAPRDRIAIATWSFRHMLAGGRRPNAPAPTTPLMTALDAPRFVAEELGLRQLEIIILHLDERTVAYAERVRAAADRVGVRFVNFQLDGQMSAPDPAVRAASIEQMKEGMRIAAALGAPTVRADVGGRAGESLDLAITADSYRQLVEFGRTIGVMPMPENHGGHSADPDKLLAIMEAVKPSGVKAILDWGNWQVQSQPERIAATRKLLPYTGLVSAKVDRFDEAYRPGYDVAELVRVVEGSGYRGLYSIEISTPPPDFVRGARVAADLIAANLAG